MKSIIYQRISRALTLLLLVLLCACQDDSPMAPPSTEPQVTHEIYQAWLGAQNKIQDTLYLIFREGPEDYMVLFEDCYISNAQEIVLPGKQAFILAATFIDSIQSLSGTLFVLEADNRGRIYFYPKIPIGWTAESYPTHSSGLIYYTK